MKPEASIEAVKGPTNSAPSRPSLPLDLPSAFGLVSDFEIPISDSSQLRPSVVNPPSTP
jgi:hypothetical protein